MQSNLRHDIAQEPIHSFVIESKYFDTLEIGVYSFIFSVFDGNDEIFFDIDDVLLFVETLETINNDIEHTLPQIQIIKFTSNDISFCDYVDHISISCLSKNVIIDFDTIPEIITTFKDNLGV